MLLHLPVELEAVATVDTLEVGLPCVAGQVLLQVLAAGEPLLAHRAHKVKDALKSTEEETSKNMSSYIWNATLMTCWLCDCL